MKSKKTKRHLLIAAVTVIIGVLLVIYLANHSIPVFEPGGVLASKEKGLLLFGLIMAVIVVVPTFVLAIVIAHKYNEKNVTKDTKYRPDYNQNPLFEFIWWGIPIVIIAILSYVAWTSAYNLSPYKAVSSNKPPLTIQVVSMDWKWLFIYPKQQVASVNLAAIPVNTPVSFKLTSDTIMNSFWVPGLGGQIYTMPGMITQIHEMATRTGDFAGAAANIAGEGFSRMNFVIRSMNQTEFSNWLNSAHQASKPLNSQTYAALAKPSMSVPVTYYSSVSPDLFLNITMKYMAMGSFAPESEGNPAPVSSSTVKNGSAPTVDSTPQDNSVPATEPVVKDSATTTTSNNSATKEKK